MRASIAVLGLLPALLAGACREGASPAGGPPDSRRAAAAGREGYRPPADGVLTPAQVETFLKVREATVRALAAPGGDAPLEGEEGISGASEARAAEVRAARALGVPVEEHLWVRERVLEAEAAEMTAKLNADVLVLLEKTLASLRNRLPAAPDDASRRLLGEQIASFEAEAARVRREAAEKEPEPVRANLGVLAPYRARLSATADELAQVGGAPVSPARVPR